MGVPTPWQFIEQLPVESLSRRRAQEAAQEAASQNQADSRALGTVPAAAPGGGWTSESENRKSGETIGSLYKRNISEVLQSKVKGGPVISNPGVFSAITKSNTL